MMIQEELVKILKCPFCPSEGLINSKQWLKCLKCHKKGEWIDNSIHFIPYDGREWNSKTSEYKTWSNWRKSNHHFFEEILSDRDKKDRILDFGAGPSQFRNLLEKFDNVLGVDIVPYEMVDIVVDITKNLPFKSNTFDILILSNVLEHLPNTESVLAECYRILKDGGIIVATIPFIMRIHQSPYDYNRYTHYKLDNLLKEANFSDITVKSLVLPIDVYEKIQNQFFRYLLDSAKLIKNPLYRKIIWWISRFSWWVTKLTLIMFKPLYRRAPISMDYTQGYGFVAYKKRNDE